MTWDECVPELLEHLGEMGLVAMVKIDGERERKPWTVVVSGQRLPGQAIRVDGHSLEDCLRRLVATLHERFPNELALS
ncbi:hypothetical protein [Micromonospora humi]|uniref:Uncharacterized protein n=1 Tax=Micromonospora humi TaxID=745366 RepID=A0A1C5HI80_9ACTN|nr:hypothetical protein [Micromonospora humi]SCG45769.1 hypothetical protein GA0070213_103161 [Micromonospora humi]